MMNNLLTRVCVVGMSALLIGPVAVVAQQPIRPVPMTPFADGQNAVLNADLRYQIGDTEHVIVVPAGFVTDFASTPRAIWAVLLGVELRLLKTPAEIEMLRAAGIIGTRAVIAAMNAAEPGATEAEVAAAAIEEIVRAGAALYGLGLSSGKWAHTFSPSSPAAYDARRRLARGEMV